MIKVEGLTKEFIRKGRDGKAVRKLAVDGLSFEIGRGEIFGLLGPNGAGKTTTFYMIVGIETPNSGTVTLDDKDISHMPMYERARAGIGYLPQEASIFSKMTVEDNIMAILETTNLSSEERVAKMNALIDEFRLDHVRKSEGKALSGGERRRVEIARALATDPAFILLDEPFAGIDPIAVADIQGMIAHLAKRGIGILITDHNVRETLSIVDKAYILADGRILLHGDSQTIANDPVARKYYLGDNFSM